MEDEPNQPNLIERIRQLKTMKALEVVNLLDEAEERIIWPKQHDNLTSEKRRKMNEQWIDALRNRLETLYPQHKPSENDEYPEYTTQGFAHYIANMPLFSSDRMTIESGAQKRKTPAQRFLSKYLSTSSPYDGVLLWHEVGAGKTCASVSMAENFRDFVSAHRQKILILCPSEETFAPIWHNHIFTVEKDACMGNGDRYAYELGLDLEAIQKGKKTFSQEMIKRYINKYYDIMGYNAFVNQFERLRTRATVNQLEDNYEKAVVRFVKEKYSNCVIIMDEAHRTKDNEVSTDGGKKIQEVLELVARYGENNKWILATATPMTDQPTEIIWLLNLLLLNSKRTPLKKVIGDKYLDTIRERSRGYISYLRAENPIDFPMMLFPSEALPMKGSSELVQRICNYYQVVRSTMSEKHAELVRNETNQDETNQDEKKRQMKEQTLVQLSNLSFAGSDNMIRIDDDKLKTLTTNFLKKDQLPLVSPKMSSILRSLQTCQGITFVFSHFTTYGTKIIQLVLEENGYRTLRLERLDGKDTIIPDSVLRRRQGETASLHSYEEKSRTQIKIGGQTFNWIQHKPLDSDWCIRHRKIYKELTTDERKLFQQAFYLHVDAENKAKSKPFIPIFNDIQNAKGEWIHTLIGSPAVKEGISFFNVREVHILEPWHNMSELVQVVGRASRRNSHKLLPPEQRNVAVYYHCASYPGSILERSPDEDRYLNSFQKLSNIVKVEQALKANAIDCVLNKEVNRFMPSSFTPNISVVKDSQGNERTVNLYDVDFSRACGFQKCDTVCQSKPSKHLKDVVSASWIPVHPLTQAYREEISIIRKALLELFEQQSVYHEEQLVTLLQEWLRPQEIDSTILRDLLSEAASHLISEQVTLTDPVGRDGYLVSRWKTYLVVPKDMILDAPISHYGIQPRLAKKSIRIDEPAPEITETESNSINYIKLWKGVMKCFKEKQLPDPNEIHSDKKKTGELFWSIYNKAPYTFDYSQPKQISKDLLRLYVFVYLIEMWYSYQLKETKDFDTNVRSDQFNRVKEALYVIQKNLDQKKNGSDTTKNKYQSVIDENGELNIHSALLLLYDNVKGLSAIYRGKSNILRLQWISYKPKDMKQIYQIDVYTTDVKHRTPFKIFSAPDELDWDSPINGYSRLIDIPVSQIVPDDKLILFFTNGLLKLKNKAEATESSRKIPPGKILANCDQKDDISIYEWVKEIYGFSDLGLTESEMKKTSMHQESFLVFALMTHCEWFLSTRSMVSAEEHHWYQLSENRSKSNKNKEVKDILNYFLQKG